jgi:hypothetical protein
MDDKDEDKENYEQSTSRSEEIEEIVLVSSEDQPTTPKLPRCNSSNIHYTD